MKPNLPDFHFIPGLLMNLVRTSAFDQLHDLFQRCCFTRREEEMKMIRHHDKFMKQIGALFAAGKNALHQDFSNSRNSKKLASLPRS